MFDDWGSIVRHRSSSQKTISARRLVRSCGDKATYPVGLWIQTRAEKVLINPKNLFVYGGCNVRYCSWGEAKLKQQTYPTFGGITCSRFSVMVGVPLGKPHGFNDRFSVESQPIFLCQLLGFRNS